MFSRAALGCLLLPSVLADDNVLLQTLTEHTSLSATSDAELLTRFSANASKVKHLPLKARAWNEASEDGLLPLSFCTTDACKKTKDVNYQYQRLKEFPVPMEGKVYHAGDVLEVGHGKDLINGYQSITVPDGVKIIRKFYTTENDLDFFYEVAMPTNEKPSAMVVVFHGYQGNGDDYLHVAINQAKDNNFVVLLMDLPGHGRSNGLLGYINDWETVASVHDVLNAIVPPIRSEYDPPLPVFGLGASMGGAMLFASGVEKPKDFQWRGHILVAPLLALSRDMLKLPMWLMGSFINLQNSLQSTWPMAPMADLSKMSDPNTERNEAWHKQHPLHFSPPRIGSVSFMLNEMLPWIRAHMTMYTLPLLIVHADQDKVVDKVGAKQVFRDSPSVDKTLHLIKNAWHSQLVDHNDPGATPKEKEIAQQVQDSVAKWINDRAGGDDAIPKPISSKPSVIKHALQPDQKVDRRKFIKGAVDEVFDHTEDMEALRKASVPKAKDRSGRFDLKDADTRVHSEGEFSKYGLARAAAKKVLTGHTMSKRNLIKSTDAEAAAHRNAAKSNMLERRAAWVEKAGRDQANLGEMMSKPTRDGKVRAVVGRTLEGLAKSSAAKLANV